MLLIQMINDREKTERERESVPMIHISHPQELKAVQSSRTSP